MISKTTNEKEKQKSKTVSGLSSVIKTTIERLANQLAQGLSTEMKHYLKVMSHFHHYSINNQMLIFSQQPDATRVAGFRTWKKLKRSVKKGEKGIRIFAPCMRSNKNAEPANGETELSKQERVDLTLFTRFRAVCVFDVSQTDGAELPELAKMTGDAGNIIPLVEQSFQENNIQLNYNDKESVSGYSRKNSITIKGGMPDAETFSTLIHEWAHVILHFSNQLKQESKTTIELEADAVACVVSEHFGINAIQSSSDYILSWKGDKNALMRSFEKIRHCASGMIEEIEKREQAEVS